MTRTIHVLIQQTAATAAAALQSVLLSGIFPTTGRVIELRRPLSRRTTNG